jgi:hypothetical protein
MRFRLKATVALGTALLAFGCSDLSQPRNPAAPETASPSTGVIHNPPVEEILPIVFVHGVVVACPTNSPPADPQVRSRGIS